MPVVMKMIVRVMPLSVLTGVLTGVFAFAAACSPSSGSPVEAIPLRYANYAPTLTASFQVVNSSATARQAVSLTASASGGPSPIVRLRYTWGDGTETDFAAVTGVVHAFAQAGSYQVTLFVTDSLGQTASAQRVVSVGVPVSGNIVQETAYAQKGRATTFRAELNYGSNTPQSDQTEIRWRISKSKPNGEPLALIASGSERSVQITWPDTGTYRVEAKLNGLAVPGQLLWRTITVVPKK